jgi:phosphopentomutase
MTRAIVLVLDSFGIGASQDAPHFGDQGADTFGHIVEHELLHQRQLLLPNLAERGLFHAALASTGKKLPGYDSNFIPQAKWGYAVEQSFGKDTPSGHWEMAGVPARFDWGYFPPDYPSFPPELIETLVKQANLPGILGNKHASGTEIIKDLGEEHIKTGKPILYTSGDSVFQIACHESYFGLEKLYELCRLARPLVDKYNIGRVIARPFVGEPGSFRRTANRIDLATPPPDPTLLDVAKASGREVHAIGKISDIFAGLGVTHKRTADGNLALFSELLDTVQTAATGSFIFSNFVDFDSKYGHRRDIPGYAQALAALDARLPELTAILQPDDLVIISADHGCDPSFPGSDHTREHVPVLCYGPKVAPGFIGRRESFADIGQTIATHLGLPPLAYGISFY